MSRRTNSSVRNLLAVVIAASLLGMAAGGASAAVPVFWEPTPYLSTADLPSGFFQGNSPTLLESFESGSLNASLSASSGVVVSPGTGDGYRDSVDADDGAIDGVGNGSSWFVSSAASGVTFTFNGGSLPTAFAVVLTDAPFSSTITFSAVDGSGNSLGSITRSGFVDNSFLSATAEDRFFGIQYADGIKSITISGTGVEGMEVDHVQYGQIAAVPEPASALLLLVGACVIAGRRTLSNRRRSDDSAA